MKLSDLQDRSVLILGFGVEGSSTFQVLRELFPAKIIGVADRNESLSDQVLKSDRHVRLHLGSDYLARLSDYDVIVKAPGISLAVHPELQRAVEAGTKLTSHTSLFFANCPGTIIGVTGTKGKGTTSKLINDILTCGGVDSRLVGNVGTPPLPLLSGASNSSVFVYELSAQQLEHLNASPHISVVLNIVQDHLDHFGSFERYVEAKKNIIRFQRENDYAVFNSVYEIPRRMAATAISQTVPYSIEEPLGHGCSIDAGTVIWRMNNSNREEIISVEEISRKIPEPFNLHNVLPAIAVGRLLRMGPCEISEAVANFRPFEHRFEFAGEYKGITFYNASIATVPEVTIEHLKTLGPRVQTMLLGGQDRGSDFSELALHILSSNVKTLILFPGTGPRIFDAVLARAAAEHLTPPKGFVVKASQSAEAVMREAVQLAYLNTDPGNVCLHSPASPSFGVFKDYKERGSLFKKLVKEI